MKARIFKTTLLASVAMLQLMPNSGMSQQARTLTLDEAVRLGIDHSPQLQTDSVNLLAAESRIRQSRNAYLPQFLASASYLRISDNITPFKVSFPSTGEVVLNPQILDQYYNSLQARQLIWAGGKLRQASDLSKLDKRALSFDLEKNKSELAFTITSLWYNIFTLRQSRKLVEANIELLDNQRRDAQNLVDQGILLANDALKLELAATGLRTDLADIDANLSLLSGNLCILTGLDVNNKIDVPDDLPALDKGSFTLEQHLQNAWRNRPELKGLSTRKDQSTLNVSLTRSNYYPTLSAGGTYNYDKPNQRLFPNRAEFTGTWNVGVFLNWNLTDLYSNRERIRESKLAVERIDNVIGQTKEGIAIEVNADYTNYLRAKQRIELATKALEQASENFRVEQNKFNNSTATATDFLNANTLLLQARIDAITAVANADLAYRKLLKSTHTSH